MGIQHQLRGKSAGKVVRVVAVERVEPGRAAQRHLEVAADGGEAEFLAWMKKRRLTVRAAAALLGVSKDTISKYRAGGPVAMNDLRSIWAIEHGCPF